MGVYKGVRDDRGVEQWFQGNTNMCHGSLQGRERYPRPPLLKIAQYNEVEKVVVTTKACLPWVPQLTCKGGMPGFNSSQYMLRAKAEYLQSVQDLNSERQHAMKVTLNSDIC